MDQSNLLENVVEFDNKIIKLDQTKKKIKERRNYFDSISTFYEGQELTLNAFRSGIFQIKATKGKGSPSDLVMHLKILTPKQMLQRLPIGLAQVTAGKTSENLLNEIRQIIYSLYRAKEITKKVYDNIVNSIKL